MMRLSQNSDAESGRYLLSRLKDPSILRALRLYLSYLHDQPSNVCFEGHTTTSIKLMLASEGLPIDLGSLRNLMYIRFHDVYGIGAAEVEDDLSAFWSFFSSEKLVRLQKIRESQSNYFSSCSPSNVTRPEDLAPSVKPEDSELSVFLLNIQSLKRKTNDLFLLLEELKFPEIFAITEHWLNIDEPICIQNYTTIARFNRGIFSHGGTLIMSTNSDFVAVTKFDILLSEKEFEFSIVHNALLDLYIICIYRSPDANVLVFCQKLLSLLESLPIKSKLILCGDFNITSVCAAQESLQSIFDSLVLEMHINSPTRITKNSSSTIDYIVSSFIPSFVDCTVLNAGFSNHEAVICRFSLESKGI
ncbi:uncharacterized protein LOC126740914 [Anthonomus grandis grandis]|uniref:uncharacterized protein LOC126740914 n=1 Tax=Anthonomus grandis grandis TaxID=2921223 RepID=UPI002165A414|nr:uncharacterized protein LOC126740914 [Anthonomus grandis grandis]